MAEPIGLYNLINNLISATEESPAAQSDPWSEEPVCYSEPEQSISLASSPSYEPRNFCAEEIDPAALTIATASLDESLEGLGVTNAENALRTFLASDSGLSLQDDEQAQTALSAYFRIYETLYFLEQEYGDSVPGLKERIAALREAISTRLVDLAGDSERGCELIAALIEQLEHLGEPSISVPEIPAETVAGVRAMPKAQLLETLLAAAAGPKEIAPEQIRPIQPETKSPETELTFLYSTVATTPGKTQN